MLLRKQNKDQIKKVFNTENELELCRFCQQYHYFGACVEAVIVRGNGLVWFDCL